MSIGLTFSQRNGLASVPSQLKIGEMTKELRALLWSPIYYSLCDGGSRAAGGRLVVPERWELILRDHHVGVQFEMAHTYDPSFYVCLHWLSSLFEGGAFNRVFDFVEFVLRHRHSPPGLRGGIATALERARSAYRLVDGNTILPIGSDAEATTIVTALSDARGAGVEGAAAHLKQSAQELRKGEWAKSVRESISAVESISLALSPDKGTLGAALAALEKGGHLHGALKSAFSGLYGYTSDEKGVRHALVLESKANVDEADALFMLGACASFVSYLISKGRQIDAI